MTLWDDRILEIIREEGHGAGSELVERDEIRVSRPHVSNRLKKLCENGLLKQLANGVYILSDEGEAYLAGEYDAEAGAYLTAGEANEPTARDSEHTEG